jgi:hypothetical protein
MSYNGKCLPRIYEAERVSAGLKILKSLAAAMI